MSRSINALIDRLVDEVQARARAERDRDGLLFKVHELERMDPAERVGRYVTHEEFAELTAQLSNAQQFIQDIRTTVYATDLDNSERLLAISNLFRSQRPS